MPRAKKSPTVGAPKEIKPRKRGRPRKAPIQKKTGVETAQPPVEKAKPKRPAYLFAVGRRKAAVARVRYYKKGEGKYLVNNQPAENYFSTVELLNYARSPLEALSLKPDGDFTVKVQGGGKRGQAEATRLGVSRLLVQLDQSYRPALKKLGFLTRDPRVKERKKYGLKRARRAPQWQKR